MWLAFRVAGFGQRLEIDRYGLLLAHFDDDDGWGEEVAVGIDYSWPVLDGLLVRAQYYRNGTGNTHPPADSARTPLNEAIEMPTCATGRRLCHSQRTTTNRPTKASTKR